MAAAAIGRLLTNPGQKLLFTSGLDVDDPSVDGLSSALRLWNLLAPLCLTWEIKMGKMRAFSGR